MARIGVVADTHCPEFLDRVPSSVLAAFAGVDVILHAGDITDSQTLDDLRRVAPVHAARGDHDRALASLPRVCDITIAGKRIILLHGNRGRPTEEWQTLLWTLSLGFYKPHWRLPDILRARFPQADIIVFGHTHRSLIDNSVTPLVMNPGGVHQWNPHTAVARLAQRPGWFEWCWLQVARNFRSYPNPSVGILEITESTTRAAIIDLSEV